MSDVWDHQPKSIIAIRKALAAGYKKPVLVSPTGSGKTRIATEIVRLATEKHNKVLFLAPRRELIYQTVDTFRAAGIDAGMIMAGESPNSMKDVQVASKDTLHARAIQRDKIIMPPAHLVIVDEAHLSITKSWIDIINHYDDKLVIGLTATPARGDGKGLGEVYDHLVQVTDVADLTKKGCLVPLRYFAPSTPDLKSIKQNKSDYDTAELEAAMDRSELIGDIVKNWKRICPDRQTVVFCTTRKHSRHVCEEFVRKGYRAEHLDGETPMDERKEILDRVRSGETQVLCNVFVATYGLDIPQLACAVLARPTKNITLYLQTLGRIMRTASGKTDGIVIDHSGAVVLHGYVDEYIPWDLDSNIDIRDAKNKAQKDQKEPMQITCTQCGTTFKSSRTCPGCGHQMVQPSEDIPTYQHDLQEIERKSKKKDNNNYTNEQKSEFFGGLKSWANVRGYKEGWASNQYKSKFGVWPNAYKDVPPCPPNTEVTGWIRHAQIKWAKRKG